MSQEKENYLKVYDSVYRIPNKLVEIKIPTPTNNICGALDALEVEVVSTVKGQMQIAIVSELFNSLN